VSFSGWRAELLPVPVIGLTAGSACHTWTATRMRLFWSVTWWNLGNGVGAWGFRQPVFVLVVRETVLIAESGGGLRR